MNEDQLIVEYGGFWRRLGACLVDSLWLIPAIKIWSYFWGGAPTGATGWLDAWFSEGWVLTIAILGFWLLWQATPGKLLFDLAIVDAHTLARPTRKQYVKRYLGYIPSALLAGLGFLWVAFDRKKQSWHDKMAGTCIIRPPYC